MNIIDLLDETYQALSSNKVRSTLTVLGIVIGIASVIAMVAIGHGAQGNIEAAIQSSGSNLITVTPGAQRGIGIQANAGRGSAQTLTQADADAIQSTITSAVAVSPELSRRYQVTAVGKNTNTNIVGTLPAYVTVRNFQVAEGVFISDADVRSLGRVAVIGPTTRDDLFGEGNDAVGQFIRINKVEFRVIGVLQAKGGTGFQNPDDAVYVPLPTAQRFLAGDTYVSSISVQAADQASMPIIQEEITALLLERHKIGEPTLADFSVLTQADIVATASTITNTVTALLASIAGISLLVGGIGIMNMMLTSVTERTREIGLRKAIGAHREDISRQFLVEAIALTFLGGLIGVLLGFVAAWVIARFGTATSVSADSVLLALAVSTLTGLVFGYYPARQASRLNPIDALRYE